MSKAKKNSIDQEEEGARNALAGYLYEVIGVHGIAVMQGGALMRDSEDDLSSVVRIAGSAVLLHEQWGQDVAILPTGAGATEAGAGGMLVQFKFSPKTPPREIQPAELKKIASKLAASAAQAEKEGHPITEFALVSNRALSPESPALLKSARNKEAIEGCNEAAREVLGKLVAATEVSGSVFRNSLEKFARRYGASESEATNAVLSLFAQSAWNVLAGGGARITKPDIVKALTGFEGARALDREDPEGVILTMREALPDLESRVVEREGMRAFSALVGTRALVVVSGPGGCGKTTSVIEWAKREADANGPGARFVQYVEASGLDDDPIARELSAWMNLARGQWITSDEVAEERLQLANPDAGPPILVLALDGADEPPMDARWTGPVEAIVRRFAQRDREIMRTGDLPIMTLVVTCRTLSDISESWLYDDVNYSPLDEPFAPVEIGEFTDSELRDAADVVEPPIRHRIQASLGPPERGSAVLSPVGPARPASPMLDEHTLRMLRHPVLWGAFVSLTPGEQAAVLMDDEAAHRTLAMRFLTRFGQKVRDRDRVRGIERKDIPQFLRDVAHACGADPGMSHSRLEWQEATRDWGGGKGIEKLYSEAEGYGLIEIIEAPRWRWKHPFIHRYLVNL